MAVTFNDIVARVKQQLLGFTRDQESLSYLVGPMTATDITFQADPETVTSLSRGIVEINDELVRVKKFDKGSGVVTVMADLNGRGVENTTATTHDVNDVIVNDPKYPKARIKEAINDAIRGVYPDLWVFGEYEFPYTAARYEYPIPANAEDVYKVVINTIGPSKVWFPGTRWRFNPLASKGDQSLPDATGRSIQIYDFVVPGRNVRVSYRHRPEELVLDTDDFEAVTGFPERYVDMMVYSACWRLLPAMESARLQQRSIEATERSQLVPTGAAADASQYYLGLYQRRLLEEQARLQELFETYATFNG